MRDPVFASDGYTYEREELLKHMAKSSVSPMTREPLDSKLIPNRSLKSDIIAFIESHPEHAADWYVSRTLSDVTALVREHKEAELRALLVEHPEIASGLIDAGATLFHCICQYGTPTMLSDYLALHQETALRCKLPKPPHWRPVVLNARLFACVRSADHAAIRTCVQLGAELNASDEEGLTPLVLAAKEGLDSTIALLVELGAPVNAQAPCGRTALHWATVMNRISTVKLLVARGANLEAKELNTGWTPLHQASYAGATEVLLLLWWCTSSFQLTTGLIAAMRSAPIVGCTSECIG